MTYVPAEDRYEQMRYRRSGRSGLQLPAVSLGLWQNFGYDRPLETSRAIVRCAFDLGRSRDLVRRQRDAAAEDEQGAGQEREARSQTGTSCQGNWQHRPTLGAT